MDPGSVFQHLLIIISAHNSPTTEAREKLSRFRILRILEILDRRFTKFENNEISLTKLATNVW
jgi:hypothetical protein